MPSMGQGVDTARRTHFGQREAWQRKPLRADAEHEAGEPIASPLAAALAATLAAGVGGNGRALPRRALGGGQLVQQGNGRARIGRAVAAMDMANELCAAALTLHADAAPAVVDARARIWRG